MGTTKTNQPIRPIDKTKARIIINGHEKEVDFGFAFSAGEILFQENKIFLFQDNSSNLDSSLLGKIFDLQGNWICDIPFPESPYPNNVSFYFYWCGYYQGNIHINFGSDSAGYRDFGATFDISRQQFQSAHAVR